MYLPHFPNGGSRLQKNLAGDHGRSFLTVFFKHIGQNIVPLVPGKINVNIRHIFSFRVDKSFKLKCVLEWIYLRDK
jgi:hypothetical protein